jgi:kinesin family protein 6/9
MGVHHAKDPHGGAVNNKQEDWSFKFDQILHNSSQETTYDVVAADIVQSVLEGYNGTILAYGQTGAGKTFTMTGATQNYKYRGIAPRAIAQIFREIQDKPETAVVVRVSYLEVR